MSFSSPQITLKQKAKISSGFLGRGYSFRHEDSFTNSYSFYFKLKTVQFMFDCVLYLSLPFYIWNYSAGQFCFVLHIKGYNNLSKIHDPAPPPPFLYFPFSELALHSQAHRDVVSWLWMIKRKMSPTGMDIVARFPPHRLQKPLCLHRLEKRPLLLNEKKSIF